MPLTHLSAFNFQLVDARTHENIIAAGGSVVVCVAGSPDRASLKTEAGATLAQPLTPTRGYVEFFTDDTTSEVDVYVMAPGGEFVVARGLERSGPNEILVDTYANVHTMVIPFSHADSTANTETATGFTVPSLAAVLPNVFIRVVDIDDTETISIGTDSTDSGDADGFIAAASVATAGIVKGTIANGTPTLGALLWVQDSANAGDEAPEASIAAAGKAITYTTSAGSDTVSGFAYLPYVLID